MNSPSEADGINALTDMDRVILSVGISTGGEAELQMLDRLRGRKIIATTIDEMGAELVRDKLKQRGIENEIEVRTEDISSKDLDYEPESLDFIYARLVLHYLSAQALETTLATMYRLLRNQGRVFVVVRSTDCNEAKQVDNYFDPVTRLTTYTVAQGHNKAQRYFHTQASISDALELAGFTINFVKQFDEDLSPSFGRDDGIWVPNNVIEVLATKEK